MTVVTCFKCGAKNRVEEGAVASLQPVCGKCGATLSVTVSYKSSPTMFRKDDVIGPYILVHRIGRGGFGEVWLGEKSGLVTTRFALKLPKDEDIDSAIFDQEASVWVQASGHTNIVPIIEADVYAVKRNGTVLKSDQIVIVSEYLQDGSLEQRLQKYKNNVFPTETALEIAQGILAGLKYLHTRQPSIIHRDLKPDNVLLQGETPRLMDFGIARLLKTNSYSRTEHISGTLPYMAPEVFKGHYSVRTDVWAAGVILYRLLSGCLPFPQPEIASLIWAIANDEPEPLPATVPGNFRIVVYKALKKNPMERYKSADEMRKALLDAKQGRGNLDSTIPAPPPPVPMPPAPKLLPRSLWIIVTVVVLLSVVAFSFYISRKPGATASGTSSEKTTSPAITADATNTNSQTDGTSVSAIPNISGGSVTGTGLVEFETSEEPFKAPLPFCTTCRITQWLVQPSDLVNQDTLLVTYTFERPLAAPRAGTSGPDVRLSETVSDSLSARTMGGLKQGLIQSINVREGQEFFSGQVLCRIAKILHARVKVKLAPRDIGRISVGTSALFQTESEVGFKGRVESINAAKGEVSVKLFDEDVFDSRGYLNKLKPKASGDMTFDVSTTAR
jgi:serine/threonine protein kinase